MLKHLFIRYTAAALLLLVVAAHLVVRHTTLVSPWMAGGFGMFSTISSVQTYYIKARTIDVAGNKMAVIIPAGFGKQVSDCIYLPVNNRFENLKQQLLLQQWYKCSDVLQAKNGIAQIDNCEPTEIKESSLQLELWQYKFDKSSNSLYGIKLKTF